MTVEFQSNPIMEAAVFSGVDPNLEAQLPRNLTGDAAKRALNELTQSYQKYKSNLHLSYEELLVDVEGNIRKFNAVDMPAKVRQAVSTKLSSMATQRVSDVETQWSGIGRFFHKLGQVFRGHGYRTLGEWGQTLASRMKEYDRTVYTAQLKMCFSGSLGLGNIQRIPDDVMEKVEQFNPEEFQQLLDEVVFKGSESLVFGAKNKFEFYDKLSEGKRLVFNQALLERGDWFAQLYDIVEGSDTEEMKTFFSKMSLADLFKKVRAAPQQFLQQHRHLAQNRDSGWLTRCFQYMVEATVRGFLQDGSTEALVQVGNLLNNYQEDIQTKKILEKPQLLTEDEIATLKRDIRLRCIQ